MPNNGPKRLATSIRAVKVFISGSFGELEFEYSGKVLSINYKYPIGSQTPQETRVACPDLSKFIKAYKKPNCKRNCYGNRICNDRVCHCLRGLDLNTHC